MKYITLPQNKQVIVDDEDFAELSKFKWHLSNGYAVRHVSTKPDIREYMHRKVNNTPRGLVTDHINGDKLDNRRSNLRVATITQNLINTGKFKKGGNKYSGVSLHKRSGLWRARINVNKKEISLGYFKTEKEAMLARNAVELEMFGAYSRVGYI